MATSAADSGGRALRLLRGAIGVRGVHYKEVAEAAGIHPSAFSRLFAGERSLWSFPPERIRAAAAAAGLERTEFALALAADFADADFPPEAARLLDGLSRLSPQRRAALLQVLDALRSEEGA